MQKGPFRHQLSYRTRDQDREQANLEDLQREDFSYQFEYRHQKHNIRLELRHFANDPDPGLGLEAQEISLSYRYEFELSPSTSYPISQPLENSNFLLVALRPGLSNRDLLALLADRQLGTGVPQAGFQLFDQRVFDRVDGRQRLAIEPGPAGGVRQSVLLIELDGSDLTQIERDYNEVRETLIAEIGQPSRSLVIGQFRDLSASAIESETFVRQEQWRSADGVLSLLIPRRNDGKVRLEVRYGGKDNANNQLSSEFEALDFF